MKIEDAERLTRERLAAIEAFKAGKPVECMNLKAGGWGPAFAPRWSSEYHYRPAVDKYWDCPEDVPGPVCWLRSTNYDYATMVLFVDKDGIRVLNSTIEWESIGADGWEYSTDRKTWRPCLKGASK